MCSSFGDIYTKKCSNMIFNRSAPSTLNSAHYMLFYGGIDNYRDAQAPEAPLLPTMHVILTCIVGGIFVTFHEPTHDTLPRINCPHQQSCTLSMYPMLCRAPLWHSDFVLIH